MVVPGNDHGGATVKHARFGKTFNHLARFSFLVSNPELVFFKHYRPTTKNQHNNSKRMDSVLGEDKQPSGGDKMENNGDKGRFLVTAIEILATTGGHVPFFCGICIFDLNILCLLSVYLSCCVSTNECLYTAGILGFVLSLG
ncbi:unnamed protein product [Vicia faba]|uniref:Uncharacterized protein n=1 Tax=Vicia faba TaxID=3906 RepID=A0AAV1ASL5_VICFA|nr:unnamed protein product [Vicia faba]